MFPGCRMYLSFQYILSYISLLTINILLSKIRQTALMLKPNIKTKNSMYLKSPLVDIIKVKEFCHFRVYFQYHVKPTHSKSRLGFDSSLAMC